MEGKRPTDIGTQLDKVPFTTTAMTTTTKKGKAIHTTNLSSTLRTQAFGTDTTLKKVSRHLQQNAVYTDLIENLVIKTQGGEYISTKMESPPQKNCTKITIHLHHLALTDQFHLSIFFVHMENDHTVYRERGHRYIYIIQYGLHTCFLGRQPTQTVFK